MTLNKIARTFGAGVAIAVAVPASGGTPTRADKSADEPIVIPAPPPGKGQIVFYRPGGTGFALGCSVNENGKKISSLGAGKYFILATDPGTHEYSVKSEAKDTLRLLVESDETQFAKCKIKMGILVGRPDISPSDEASFRKQKHLKMVHDDDMGPGPGALRSTQVAEALAHEGSSDSAPQADGGDQAGAGQAQGAAAIN